MSVWDEVKAEHKDSLLKQALDNLKLGKDAEAALLFRQLADLISKNGKDAVDDLIWASDVTIRALQWLWMHRIPREHLTLLVGDGGVGKGIIMVDLTARLTTGQPLPYDERDRQPTKVLWVGAEDAIDSVVVPRLRVAKADVGRVAFLRISAAKPFSLPAEAGRLESHIRDNQFGLVVLDSVTSYLDHGLKSNNEQDVRQALLPLNPIAQQTGSTILASIHVNKMSDQAAGHRILGSVAWRNVSRSTLVAGKHPDEEEQYGLASNKSNLGPAPLSLGYTIESARAIQKVRDIKVRADTAKVVWAEDSIDLVADDLMPRRASRERGRPAEQRIIAETFLRGELSDGPRAAESLRASAEAEGVKWRTVERAKEAMGVVAERREGKWWWRLP